MTYDSYEPRSHFGFLVFLAFLGAAVLGLSAYLLLQKNQPRPEEPAGSASTQMPQEPVLPPQVEPETESEIVAPTDPFDVGPRPLPDSADTVARPTPEQMLIDTGMGVAELDPEVLLRRIGVLLEEANVEQASLLIGKRALDQAHLKGLEDLVRSGDFRLNPQAPLVEIGEIEANRRARWALNVESEKPSRIYFDLQRQKTGSWRVEKIRLSGETESRAVFVDAPGVTHAFLEAALQQNFDDAKSYVDSSKVSDAKIAGLCIIFEEAKYRLRPKKPLRAMFVRDLTAGFMAHVEAASGDRATDFGLSLQRVSPDSPWRVTEVNLDSLLADYANRVAGGDVHYIPLVRNPAGGDTLILYFGFDEDGLTPRTRRQLDIVAELLKIDSEKKLTLSGHTDSLGTDQYNQGLSARRAEVVKGYLLQSGVPVTQIVAVAEGEARPRLPNRTESGDDNPSGRRANRRTEIYLDF